MRRWHHGIWLWIGLAVFCALYPMRADAWSVELQLLRVHALPLHPSGDAFVVGSIELPDDDTRFFVARLEGETGTVLWKHELLGSNPLETSGNAARAAAVAANGDLVVVGTLTNLATVDDVTAIRFDGTTGSELWRTTVREEAVRKNDFSDVVAVDGPGDVYLVAELESLRGDSSTLLVKLDRDTGVEIWSESGLGEIEAIAASGIDLFIGGHFESPNYGILDIARIAGRDGSRLWGAESDVTTALALGPAGFPVSIEGDDAVMRDPENGNVLWRRPSLGSGAPGRIRNSPDGGVFTGPGTLLKLQSFSGVELWRTRVDGFDVGSGGDVAAFDASTVRRLDPELGATPFLWERSLHAPYQIAVDGFGNALVADALPGESGSRILKLSAADGNSFIDCSVGVDSDADGVADGCDNCTNRFNPRLGTLGEPERASFQTTTGGQLDDDNDGFGNACDPKFDTDGAFVGGSDLADMRASINKARSGSDCGILQNQSCSRFDLDNRGRFIGGVDFIGVLQRFNQSPGPKCDACPLSCVGPGC